MEATIRDLVAAAYSYKDADAKLGAVCGENMDPIACTIYARNNVNVEHIPIESHDAAFYLNEVVRLHGVLVQDYGMDTDKVRNIWFPILN